jgi:serine/threonine protein kinase
MIEPKPETKSATIRYFGDYVLLGEIARGGMGIVYNARQIRLNRRVALKLIRSGEMATEKEVRRFRTEAEAAARLDHPHIVPIYEIGTHDGHPFIAMKLIEGDSLADQLAMAKTAGAGSPPPTSTGHPAHDQRVAAQCIAKLARAVAHAHARGVLHRDIKPGNILIDAHGEPHLTDFGVAKLVEREALQTVTHALVGTPDYMSPEQATGSGGTVTAASDLYSLGAVFYTLLTGRPPGERSLTHGPPRYPSAAWPEPVSPRIINRTIAPSLEIICLKCLETDPARRYPDAQSLAQDLERWLANEPIRARPNGPGVRVAKWLRRNPVVTGIAATLFLGGFMGWGGANWLAKRSRPSVFTPPTPDKPIRVTTSDTALQALANHAYGLQSSLETIVTLPATPSPGDVVRLQGLGSGGWSVSLNSNQVILTDKLGVGEAGRHWINRGGDRQWNTVASSSDGQRLIATDFGYRRRGGEIWVSSDAGEHWKSVAPLRLWNGCAMSANGDLLAAAAAFGKLYLSTNFGQTWRSSEPRRNWAAIACSSDGQRLVALDNGTNSAGGHIYVSVDRGLTWTAREAQRHWFNVGSSDDGLLLAAGVGEANYRGELVTGFVYVSRDGGTNWTSCLTDRPRCWRGLSVSPDGRTLCAVEDNSQQKPGGHVYVSTDGGRTWTPRGPARFWNRISVFPDGRLFAIVRDSVEAIHSLAYSWDLGTNWIECSMPGYWSDTAASRDGRRLVATSGHFNEGRGSGLFTSVPTTWPGAVGAVRGRRGADLELRYVGGGQFEARKATGRILVEGAPIRPGL